MKKKLLWLDDIRDPKEETWNNYIAKNIANPLNFDITWVKNFEEFIDYLKVMELPDYICFDHDLHDEHYTPEKYWDDFESSEQYQIEKSKTYKEKTGLDCAKWLINHCKKNNLELPRFHIHSANPVGARNILMELIKF